MLQEGEDGVELALTQPAMLADRHEGLPDDIKTLLLEHAAFLRQSGMLLLWKLYIVNACFLRDMCLLLGARPWPSRAGRAVSEPGRRKIQPCLAPQHLENTLFLIGQC